MKKVSVDIIARLGKQLDETPVKSPEAKMVSTAEAVRKLRGSIQALRARGYTLDEIAEILSEGDLPIGGKTLKTYLSPKKRKSTAKKTVRKRASQTGGNTPATPKKLPETRPAIGFEVRPDRKEI
ncbi:hypothetical protein [Microvirga sp. VF16]|uniref:hypothetical protein n=1 Tax=Microvirga sp. VF16 TaxID=2807101 RepID=UPI00193E794B|nr:hypothetical protein [Microvirga sp. VF16]QRM35857.1 hypothetical protein JO965_46570 [Microvirga sp. VF16]